MRGLIGKYVLTKEFYIKKPNWVIFDQISAYKIVAFKDRKTALLREMWQLDYLDEFMTDGKYVDILLKHQKYLDEITDGGELVEMELFPKKMEPKCSLGIFAECPKPTGFHESLVRNVVRYMKEYLVVISIDGNETGVWKNGVFEAGKKLEDF